MAYPGRVAAIRIKSSQLFFVRGSHNTGVLAPNEMALLSTIYRLAHVYGGLSAVLDRIIRTNALVTNSDGVTWPVQIARNAVCSSVLSLVALKKGRVMVGAFCPGKDARL